MTYVKADDVSATTITATLHSISTGQKQFWLDRLVGHQRHHDPLVSATFVEGEKERGTSASSAFCKQKSIKDTLGQSKGEFPAVSWTLEHPIVHD
jgi:hypothetical protein